MTHWKNQVIDLGVIQAGKAKTIIFKATNSIPLIKEINPYCGCTAPSYDRNKKELKVTYSNGKIPNQVQGPQSITKRIDVVYEDDSVDVLTIKAIRVR